MAMIPKQRRPNGGRKVQGKTKVLLTVFFDQDGAVHHKFTPEGQAVNK
jgi:Transposase.